MDHSPDAINILLISDDASRTTTVCDVLHATRPNCRLHTIGAGHGALAYLRQQGPYENAPSNDLILFDLIEAGSADLRLLQRIKADRKLAAIPIVLLTTEKSEEMIAALSEDRRNQVMFSPIDLARFMRTMGSIRRDRFLNALQLIENLGYVPVRLPDEAEVSRSRVAI
ncbi:MAG: hypothetical protein KJO31_00680 [Gammaproteobacteria bacterium]|nr:hypothetical protein [Gammaproteobacteria bacterium]